MDRKSPFALFEPFDKLGNALPQLCIYPPEILQKIQFKKSTQRTNLGFARDRF